MKTMIPLQGPMPYLASLAVAALLMTGCSNADNATGMNDPESGTDEQVAAPDGHGAGDQVNGSSAYYTREGGLIILDDRAGRKPALTAAEERAFATSDLNAIRAPLVAELERVRERLNVGERTQAATQADQARAAELAQGLERVDRALAKIGECNDLTWKTVRMSQMKEVEDVREWLVAYRIDRTSSEASMGPDSILRRLL